MLPAVSHAMNGDMTKQFATSPNLQTPEAQQAALRMGHTIAPFLSIVIPFAILFFALIEALIMLVFNAVGHGTGTFKTLWASSVNIGIIYGLGQVVAAIVVLARGAESFGTNAEVQRAVPSLALLAPGGADVKLLAFLATLNPFTIWSVILVVMTMIIVARAPRVHAWLTGIVCYAFPALIAVVFAK
jgi:hypothetical protein